jgi:hypothetical protein
MNNLISVKVIGRQVYIDYQNGRIFYPEDIDNKIKNYINNYLINEGYFDFSIVKINKNEM